MNIEIIQHTNIDFFTLCINGINIQITRHEAKLILAGYNIESETHANYIIHTLISLKK